ncbi:MAG: peptidyl-prolyl cis-trans isomerase [Alphaproteobacteria bacterium GM202ARS2]|nr:peptidyl-prolyl cis-trans isomerase [Alphaproteobacteria bacterium GM202ARS2]
MMERKATRLLLLPLSVLLIASFALWGITDIFTLTNQDVVIAEVGDVEIEGNDFLRLYNAQTEQVRAALGRRLDYDMGKKLGFIDSVVSDLVNRALFDQASLDLGLAAGDTQARQVIFATPDFHDERGTFNELVFRQVLRDNLYTEERFIKGLRQDMRRQQLTASMAGILHAPAAIISPLVAYRGEARSADSIILKAESVSLPDKITSKEQRAWYEENKDSLMTPTYRQVSLLAVDVYQLGEEMAIDDERLRGLYDERKAYAYTQPERRDIYQILSDDEDAIRRAVERVRKGEDFLAVAKDLFDKDKEDVDIGWNRKDQVIEDLADDVFSLAKGKVSDPLRSPFGWHAMLVHNIEEEKVTPFDDVKKALRDELILDEGMDALFDLYGQVEDAFAGGGTLEEAAQAINVEVRAIDSIDSAGLSAQGKEVDSLPDPARVVSRLFETPVGETSDVIETEVGFFVVRVDDETLPRQKTFKEARKDIIEVLTQEKKSAILRERIEDIKGQLNKKASLASIAKKLSLKVVPIKPFTRSNFVEEEVPAAMVDALFAAERGEAVAVEVDGGSYMVALLRDIIETPKEGDDVETLRESIKQSLRQDLVSQYARYLRLIYPIDINERSIQELLDGSEDFL